MSTPPVYRFADVTLDVGQARLERDGEPIELGRLTYRLLLAFVESAPNVLTHDELVRRVWGGRATSPETVVQRVKLLRDALQDDAERPRYIGLVRGQGYRLIAAVEPIQAAVAILQRAVPPSPAGWRRPGMALAGVAAVLTVSVAAAGYLWLERGARSASTSSALGPLDFEITQLTSSGKAISPAISPDGQFVVYSLMDAAGLPTSLWVRQIGTTRDIEVVAPSPATIVVSAAISPDGRFIDYVKTSNAAGRELWRVPFLGGTPRRLRSYVSSAVGWSPNGKQAAFVAFDELDNTSLVVRDAAGEERVLATRKVPTYFASTAPSEIHLASRGPRTGVAAVAEQTNLLAPRIVIIDTMTGEETAVASQGSFVTQGVGWLGPSTLVLSQPSAFGQRIQLHRMSLPSGEVTPLTNDLSSYLGVELDKSGTRLATTRRTCGRRSTSSTRREATPSRSCRRHRWGQRECCCRGPATGRCTTRRSTGELRLPRSRRTACEWMSSCRMRFTSRRHPMAARSSSAAPRATEKDFGEPTPRASIPFSSSAASRSSQS
jgi:DNA-binding winged helix-turn-helix (wHTH) protein